MQHENVKAEVCKILNKIGALQFGTFKLTSGKISPYYIDLRVVPSFPDAFKRICDIYTSFVKEIGAENFERDALDHHYRLQHEKALHIHPKRSATPRKTEKSRRRFDARRPRFINRRLDHNRIVP